MLPIPDLKEPRYLREVGWFLRYQKDGPFSLGETFDEERTRYSRLLLEEVLSALGRNRQWLEDKKVASIGCGCTGDLVTWPAEVKVGIDPLAAVYQSLGMLAQDLDGTPPTVYLSVGVESLPLLDSSFDLVLCRNALDHMLDPDLGLRQMHRVLIEDGSMYLCVDIGGEPTPDEPTVFTEEALLKVVERNFRVAKLSRGFRPYSGARQSSIRILAEKKSLAVPPLNGEEILQSYLDRYGDEEP